jgi:prepilin-type N-terminal cleavage/methylation domain-containing protein
MASLRSTLSQSEGDEGGFTLIELLVVILIIGILASIAIPVFVNQRRTANDAAAVSEATNLAKAIETYFVDNKDVKTISNTSLPKIKEMVKQSKGVGAVITGTQDDYCIQTWHENGKLYRNDNNWIPNGRPYYLYSSKLGGNAFNSNYANGISELSCFLSPMTPQTIWAP